MKKLTVKTLARESELLASLVIEAASEDRDGEFFDLAAREGVARLMRSRPAWLGKIDGRDVYESSDKPVRKIVTPPVGNDGLFVQTDAVGSDRERDEAHNRERFANHFHYADPLAGNARTFDPKGNYNCGACNMAKGTECLLVDLKAIDAAAGSCGDWEGRDAGDSEIRLHLKTVETAGYGIAQNGEGFGCFRCPYASKAVQPDSEGRNLYCGKGDFRVFPHACCGLNGAATVPIDDKGMPAAKVRESKGNGRWITIGGHKGEGGERSGGSPVHIENGKITKGHPSLTGKKISALKDKAEGGSVKKANKQETEYSRARAAKAAKREGIKPEHLHGLASEIKAHHDAFVKDHNDMLATARKALGAEGKRIHLAARQGKDAGSIPGMDEVGEDMAKRYPHLFPSNQHDSDTLFDLLKQGNKEPMDEKDAYEQALDELRHHRDEHKTGDSGSDEGEFIPF